MYTLLRKTNLLILRLDELIFAEINRYRKKRPKTIVLKMTNNKVFICLSAQH